MKKIRSLAVAMLFAVAGTAQVGVNTTSPNASLDIRATNSINPTATDGILIPRIDDFSSVNPGADQDGMLVFVSGNGVAQKGFYYWDNDAGSWNNISSVNAENGLSLNSGTVQLGGTLIQGTQVDMANNNMLFNSSGIGRVLIENSGATDRSLGITKTDASNGLEYGIRLDKTSNGGSLDYGIYTVLDGNGSGAQHATYNVISTTGAGNKYGLYNVFSVGSPSAKIGVLNSYNSDQGDQTGLNNLFGGDTSEAVIGVSNALSHDGTGSKTGVSNSFSGANGGSVPYIGIDNTFSDNGGGIRRGVLNFMEGSGNGMHYGIYSDLSGTGSGDKYGTFNTINASAGGTHYGTYNQVSAVSGWAGYFIGKNYISGRLSIGEENNDNARLNISYNSALDDYHIELEETVAGDGARIRFSNSAETSNDWVIYGEANNVNSNSLFRLTYDRVNDLLEVYGDGRFKIDGRLGINFDNPSYALQLPNEILIAVGSARATNWTTYSDGRVKSQQRPVKYGLKEIMELNPKSYLQHSSKFEDGNLLVDGTVSKENIGFIAQELYDVLPEAVYKPEDESSDLWSVDYDKLIPVTVRAIQELQNELEIVRAENEQLRLALQKIESLENRLSALENQNNSEEEATELED